MRSRLAGLEGSLPSASLSCGKMPSDEERSSFGTRVCSSKESRRFRDIAVLLGDCDKGVRFPDVY